MSQQPRKKAVPEGLREEMQPQPFPVEGLGLQLYATSTDLDRIQDAMEVDGMLVVMNRLLRADMTAINAAAQHCLMYSDRTAWSGDVDTLPVGTMELGALLADAVHRRLFGTSLELDKPIKGAIEAINARRQSRGAADA
ncbi:hypothetical protein [Mesorhizobium sp. WSM3876]|uniref:hypothetical protein n=1 Tax=Mesorhizobium sp. WSM3876 TaxID=422277 RepID=UPI000BAE9A9A|nr:hypothetical protein [Mesorhizobium sp. WSM3876]PBB85726.1 hypothetical protein CK216_16495 [Mesorhizobium sp. WSM3876]